MVVPSGESVLVQNDDASDADAVILIGSKVGAVIAVW